MSTIRKEVGLSFDDVLLLPQRTKVESRNDVNIAMHLAGNHWLSIPIVASPMSTVCEARLARRLSELGGTGIIHRFMSIDDQVKQYKEATKPETPGIELGETYFSATHWAGCAVGINEKTHKKSKKIGSYKRIERLYEAGCRLFAIDVAVGYSDMVAAYMGNLPGEIPYKSTFISGSVATEAGARFCVEVGFDAIRVGIGNGSACSTREQTGHGVPQLSALMEVSSAIEGVKSKNGMPVRVISCGGIRSAGDAVKAIAAGANTVMLGQYLAGCDEAPTPGKYQGQASAKAKEEAGMEAKYVEGRSGNVQLTGTLEATLNPLLAGIRSGVSYSGAKSLVELQEVAQFQVVAPGVQEESKVRI